MEVKASHYIVPTNIREFIVEYIIPDNFSEFVETCPQYVDFLAEEFYSEMARQLDEKEDSLEGAAASTIQGVIPHPKLVDDSSDSAHWNLHYQDIIEGAGGKLISYAAQVYLHERRRRERQAFDEVFGEAGEANEAGEVGEASSLFGDNDCTAQLGPLIRDYL